MRGRVKYFDPVKNYGHIIGEDKKEYFVHANTISVAVECSYLVDGEAVEFQPVRVEGRLQAHDVMPLATKEKPKIHVSRSLVPNPFTPQDPIKDPRYFSGREEEIATAVHALFNNCNILVTGERGVGKSSLAQQLLLLCEGERALLDRIGMATDGFEFSYLAASHACQPGDSLKDIVLALARDVAKHLGEDSDVVETTEVALDAKLLSIRDTMERTRREPTTVAGVLVDAIVRLVETMPQDFNGICLTIDEVDVIDTGIPFAPFLKAVSESLGLRGVMNVSVMVVGVTGTMTALLSQHPSSSRLLTPVPLPLMTEGELRQILLSTLEGSGRTITRAAINRIVARSNRLPAPVQLLGYYSFQSDSDGEIDSDDVATAEAIITRNKTPEYSGMLKGLAGDQHANRLIEKMSGLQQGVDLEHVARLLHLTAEEAQPVLKRLIAHGVLVVTSEDVYQFKDPLFRLWLFLKHRE